MRKSTITKSTILFFLFMFCTNLYSQTDGKIIFTKNREIHSMNPDGSNIKQLTDYKVPGHTPISLSASTTKDGTIAYIYDPVNHGWMSTYVMNANGTNKKRISKEPKSTQSGTWGTTISPDGKYYVFESKRSNNIEIYRMNADGSNIINISRSSTDDEFPKWSSDSKHIIYTTKNEKSGWNVVITDLEGNNKKTLIHSKEEIRNVAYSKDTKQIAYCVDKSNSSDLMLASFDGLNVRKIKTISQYSNLSFSPDNKSITFVSKNNKIATMKLDGTDYKELTTGSRPVWSYN